MNKTEKIKFLKSYMQSKGFNQTQCAKDIKVTKVAVGFWLSGQRNISEPIIELIKYKMDIK